jgi:hypothetical protein
MHNEDLYCSLASLSQKVAQALRSRPDKLDQASLPVRVSGQK